MEKAIIGCCGISCCLCPRFQSKSKSRCAGCRADAHCPYCTIHRCCAMKRGYKTCAECGEYPCGRFKGWSEHDSFVTHCKCPENLLLIKKAGEKDAGTEQAERRMLLEEVLEKYNPGQCMSLYCLASALLPIRGLKSLLKDIRVADGDKPKLFKSMLLELAKKEGISLKLRK